MLTLDYFCLNGDIEVLGASLTFTGKVQSREVCLGSLGSVVEEI